MLKITGQFPDPITPDQATQHSADQHVAGDARGLNFFNIDTGFQDLLRLYLTEEEQRHFWPHFEKLGELAGGKLDEWAALSDKNTPVLHNRDRFGRDRQWIEHHPAYKNMEQVGFYDYGLHAAPHRSILGWKSGVSPMVKFGLHYLFSQAEFGLMCPLAVTELAAMLVLKYGTDELKEKYGKRMISLDPNELLQGAQFMTEKAGGSDVGANELQARFDGENWRLYGEKFFCSNPDCGVAVLLARCEGDPEGTAGLTAFVVPRDLEDGSRNEYQIMRLKDKLGSRSLASGEIKYNGATAYILGGQRQGIKILLDQVNMSRLSHGMRAAATMRRALNESLVIGRTRYLFGKLAQKQPLFWRQLLQVMVPTEAALSTSCYGADVLRKSEEGSNEATQLLRIITPVIKMRSNRDNVRVCAKSIEIRGGNGAIEDWSNGRLLRDSFIPVLWEGTSVINAIDVTRRAIGKSQAHIALSGELHRLIDEATEAPIAYRERLRSLCDKTIAYAEAITHSINGERYARLATSKLYHALSATLLAWEGCKIARTNGDATRLLLSRFIVDHQLDPAGALELPVNDGWEAEAAELLLSKSAISLDRAAKLVDWKT